MKTNLGSIIPQISPKTLLAEVSSIAPLPAARERRVKLVEEMGTLDSTGLSCRDCSGFCCTNEHNSMQVDPIQTLELLAWLEGEGRLNQDLEESVESAIGQFRLDREFSLGRGRELRQRYTCPFYIGKSKGCSVSRYAKPYGCLAFNPLEENVTAPGKCASNTQVLIAREDSYSEREREANAFIKERLRLYWDKKNLPFAIKDMMRALSERASKSDMA